MNKWNALDIRLVFPALLAVAVVIIIAQLLAAPPGPPLSVRNADADGAMVLRLWLEQSGYTVREVLSKPIQPEPVRVLAVLDPTVSYSDTEVARIHDWVKNGNTLIVTGSPATVNGLLDSFHVRLGYLSTTGGKLSPAAPTLNRPPVDPILTNRSYGVFTTRNDVVIHLTSSNTVPVLVSFQEGTGTVWVSGADDPFTNRALSSDPASASLMMNLFTVAQSKAVIGFDETHHGLADIQSLTSWLLGTTPGLGILLALALTMVFLALHGRRFGRPLPLPDERLRREPVEYIQAMANLFRRSGQRSEMLRHYRTQFRRRISERYVLDPNLNDVDWLKTLVYRFPAVDEAALRDLLKRLARPRISEQELLSTATDADDWLRRLL